MVSIEVTGLDSLIKKMQHVASPEMIDEFMAQMGDMMLNQARAYSPVRTGDMMNGINKNTTEQEIELFCDVPYAVYNEYGSYTTPAGTPENPIESTGPVSGKVAYRPFMRSAVYTVMNEKDKIFDMVFRRYWNV